MSETNPEKGFLERTGDWMKRTFDAVKDEASQEGAYNYLIAIPGALLGFMFTQNMVGSWFGGGLLSQIAAFPLAITAGMAGAVLMTKGFNKTLEWTKENFGDVTPAASPAAEPAPARAPTVEVDGWTLAAAEAVAQCKGNIEAFQVNGTEGAAASAIIGGEAVDGTIRTMSCGELTQQIASDSPVYTR